MKGLLAMIVPLYLTYYTCTYAMMVWKEDNRFAAGMIVLLGLLITILPIWGMQRGLF